MIDTSKINNIELPSYIVEKETTSPFSSENIYLIRTTEGFAKNELHMP